MPLFVYYLTISKLVRQPAIKSMVGSSGRQRVQQSALDDLTIPVFSLSYQQHIVDTRQNMLECRIKGLSYPEIGRVLSRAQSTVFEYFIKMRQRYIAIYG